MENKKIKKEDINLKVKSPMPKLSREKIKEGKVSKNLDIVTIPPELKDAPKQIQDHYIRFIELYRIMESRNDRYFNFMNTVTKEMEMIDMMGLPGVMQKMAHKKNIGQEDFDRMEVLINEYQVLRIEKAKCKAKWTAYTAPLMGRDIMSWKKGEIIDLYAKYYTHDEIREWLRDAGYEVNTQSIYKFYLTNKETIDKKRVEFLSTSRDYYIATEAGRMETLAVIHNKLMSLFEKVNSKDYSLSNSQEIRQLSASICNVLEHARKEIKGDELKLTIDGKIDISASLQASRTIKDITKKIPINLIVTYLVSAKAGLDPSMLLTSLIHSFYSEFNGFGVINEAGKPPDSAELIKNYDWMQIKAYHKNKEAEKIGTIVEYETIPPPKKQVIATKRQLLLKMLEEQKDGVQDNE